MSNGKALFRAIKRKSRVTETPGLFLDLDKQDAPISVGRVARDYYPTALPEAILALLAYDGDRIRQSESVWEPACGKGDLVRHIRAAGIPCCASDIEDRGCPDSWVADYFTCLRSRGGAIITNPPYNLINAGGGHGRWLRHTLTMPGWDYLALLLDWSWPLAVRNGLGRMLDTDSFTRVYGMRWKLDFQGNGSPPQRNAWFIWDRRDPRSLDPSRNLPPPEFRFMDRVDPRQSSLL